MSKHQPPAEDPWRLHCAAHELGHCLAWRALGFEVRGIEVSGSGVGVEGATLLTDRAKTLSTPQRCHDYLIGLLAGRESDILWARRAGRPFRERHSAFDLRIFRKIRRHEWVKDTPDRVFRAEAARLVGDHWTQIVRMTPQLADRGRL